MRAERAAVAIAGDHQIRVIWCRELPNADYAWVYPWGDILLSEEAWTHSTAEDNRDTIAHEIAHLHAWAKHGRDIADHGREWRRIYRKLLARTPAVG